MSLVIDQADINAFLDAFNVPSDEYHLTFEDNIIYVHWVVNPKQLQRYLKNDTQCLDVDISDTWKDAQYISDIEEVPAPDGFISCRYILAA